MNDIQAASNLKQSINTLNAQCVCDSDIIVLTNVYLALKTKY